MIEDFSVIEQRNAEQIAGWAEFLIRRWDAQSLEFVIPVMWENGETTYYGPLESGWREKLQWV